ncbi:MAG TPA: biotin/lipoyl-containing protein [Prolixibacteraceae bacterium]|nr:biotin/lipoyl-containing protein [Prolixibacteraceae bacterium]
MEKRKVKFSLVYRDMWQSSGKYLPRVDQLVKVAPAIIEMGCFARVETNGGGFEQINLLFGENPNNAVRQWSKPFNEAGIQTHMLDRSLNALRMSPVPADVRKLMYKVKKAQGTDITRPFCGLNDARNILDSIKYAKAAGMIAQAALSLTYSKVHTVESYVELADTLIKGGADEICLKDMAGIGRPAWLAKIVTGIKQKHPNIPLQYHSHAGPGFAMASILEVCRAGVEYVDVAMEPLSWGTGHVDVLAVQAMLKDAGFDVPEINMDAYMKVRSLTQSFIDDFLGYYIDNKNRYMNSLLIGSGLPGGMMGSLMADLSSNLDSINKWKVKNNKPELTQDDLLVKLFNEVEYIWPMVGYPPLVTPYSQYVKNLALMNVMQMERGKARWGMIADDIWDMLMGKGGKLPGELHPDILKLAKAAGKEQFTAHPQSVVEDALPKFRKEMEDNGWDFGLDDEELFELAMHPQQYRAYKSGDAKRDFEEDLAKRKSEGAGLMAKSTPAVQTSLPDGNMPTTMNVNVNGENFKVTVSYGEANGSVVGNSSTSVSAAPVASGNMQEVQSPLEGKFYLTKNTSETAIKVGDMIKEGDLIGYVEAMKTFNAIRSDKAGKVAQILKSVGEDVEEDEVLVLIG